MLGLERLHYALRFLNSQIPLFRRVKKYYLWTRILQKNRRNIQEDDRLIGDPRRPTGTTTKGNYE